MSKIPAVTTIFCVLSIIAYIYYPQKIYAQSSSSGYAVSIPIKGDAEEGDLVCTSNEGFVLCDTDFATSLYGVVVGSAPVQIEDSELENSRLVLTSGIAKVKVTSAGGDISEGNLITTSEIPGVGKLATKNGYVLGAAMENYSNENIENIGKIQVTINIHPASGLRGRGSNLVQFIREGLAVPVFDPVESLRYLLAVAMVVLSFTLGMIYFGRSSRAGIEAVGRNPLAKKVIQMTVFLNIILTVVIVLVGLAVAYLILIL